jgi:hypothetical protein
MLGKMVLYKMPFDQCGWRKEVGADGCVLGNQNGPGDLAPAIITAVWKDEYAGLSGERVDGYNLMVFPDGRTPIWATSVKFGDNEREIQFPKEEP